MKKFILLASIVKDLSSHWICREVLTPLEELARFETEDEIETFMDTVKRLASIREHSKLFSDVKASIPRIKAMVMDANSKLDHKKAHAFALLMSIAEENDDYETFYDLAQQVIEYPAEVRQ